MRDRRRTAGATSAPASAAGGGEPPAPTGGAATSSGGAAADAPLGDLLLAATRAMRRRWGAALEPWGLAPHTSRALRVVCSRDDDDAPRLADIAAALRIAPRSATEVVDALAQRGLVRREPSPSDRRAVVVTATQEGRRVHDAVEAARQASAEEFLAPLSDPDRATLRGLLERLIAD
ncbi:MarR family winged helix-turn-helix transcriptional regulator [Beutenbergia cavernae]|nr:MarR family transcriptional regulator [Beutenbergia cavernae]